MLPLTEVARRCGAHIDTMRILAGDGLLPGAVRVQGGDVFVREDLAPDRDGLLALLGDRYLERLNRAHDAYATLRDEIDGLGCEIDQVLENPLSPLGERLMGLRGGFVDPRNRPALLSGLHQLEQAAWEVRLYSAALRREALR